MRAHLAGGLAALTVAATACSAGSSDPGMHDHEGAAPDAVASAAATPGAGGTQQVTISATNDFRFSPATISAHPGALQVTLDDTGSYPHNLAVAALHFTSKTVTGSTGQQSTTFTLHFDKPGTYKFVCTFHSSAGMVGEFVIA